MFSQAVKAPLDFIANLPIYDEQKPFIYHASATLDLEESNLQLSNLVFEPVDVVLRDMRDEAKIGLERNGFCFVNHVSKHLPMLDGAPALGTCYRRETEDFLKSYFEAELVICYDYKRRRNLPMNRDVVNPLDLDNFIDAAAVGVHVDTTIDEVEPLLRHLLDQDDQRKFLKPEYRVRIINTWRSLLPTVEDRPLAVCDFSSVDSADLLATDRVYPTWVKEIYYLKHNARQRWYWLPRQQSSEPLIFVTYDSLDGGYNARYCPHASFDNPASRPGVQPRESVETRCIVISKLAMDKDRPRAEGVTL